MLAIIQQDVETYVQCTSNPSVLKNVSNCFSIFTHQKVAGCNLCSISTNKRETLFLKCIRSVDDSNGERTVWRLIVPLVLQVYFPMCVALHDQNHCVPTERPTDRCPTDRPSNFRPRKIFGGHVCASWS